MHCLACANKLTKRCSWISFCPSPILELFHILLALMHGIKEYFSNSFFPLLSLERVTLMPWDELGANQLANRLYLKVVFPSWILLKKIIPTLIKKIFALHVQPTPSTYLSTTCTFSIWMSTLITHVVFVALVSFKLSNYEPKHVTIGLFETTNTSGVSMVTRLQHLFNMFNFFLFISHRWGVQFANYVIALDHLVSCNYLVVFELFDGSYFEHALFNFLIWITFNNKITHGFKYTSIKSIQVDVKKFIILSKNLGWGVASLGKTYVDFGLKPKNFNMLMKQDTNVFHFFLSDWTLLKLCWVLLFNIVVNGWYFLFVIFLLVFNFKFANQMLLFQDALTF